MNPPMADWANFFVAEVGASAALAGLVVVAISINLSRILSFPQLPARAAESLMMLTAALLLASFGLIPGQPTTVFGVEVLLIGIALAAVTAYNQLRPLPPIEGVSALRRLLRVAISACATLPIVVGGVLLILGASGGLYWLAAGVLVSLASGVWNAWILLIEIMR